MHSQPSGDLAAQSAVGEQAQSLSLTVFAPCATCHRFVLAVMNSVYRSARKAVRPSRHSRFLAAVGGLFIGNFLEPEAPS